MSTSYIFVEDKDGGKHISGTWIGEKLLVEPNPEHCPFPDIQAKDLGSTTSDSYEKVIV